MPNDLSDAIREALHANEIEAHDLIQPSLRDRPVRNLSRWLAPAAAAAITVLIVAGIGFVMTNHSHDHIASSSMDQVVGYVWRITAIVDSEGTASIPGDLPAQIAFTGDGYVIGHDTVNTLSGTYQETPDGYAMSPKVVSTMAFYGGGNPLRLRVVKGVDYMFFASTPPSAEDQPLVAVEAALDGATLTLRRDDVTLTLRRAGTQGNLGN
jgi:hypothetical protein